MREMEARYLALTTIFLFSLVCIPTAFGRNNVSDSNYNYCDFVQQWRITSCSIEACEPGRAEEAFGIDGLWPAKLKSDGTSNYVTHCNTETVFDPSEITGSLLDNLQEFWPSLTDADDEDLWKKEWEKHGTCFKNGDNVVDYFKTTVSLRKKYKILGYLEDDGIQVGVPYDVSQITKAITTGLSKTVGKKVGSNVVQIMCIRPGSTNLVHQIFLCLDKRGINLTSCPRKRKTCSGTAILPDTTTPDLQWLHQLIQPLKDDE